MSTNKKSAQRVTWHDGIRQVHKAVCSIAGPDCGCPLYVPERTPDGRRRWERVEDLDEAKTIKLEFDAALARARYEGVYERATMPTIEQLVGRTLRSKKGVLKPSTFFSYEHAARRFVLGETGDESDRYGVRFLPSDQFDVDAGEAWLDRLIADVGNNHTAYKGYQIFRLVLNDAVNRRKMKFNPFMTIQYPMAELPSSKKARDRRLTREQVSQLTEACFLARHRLLIRIGVEACLRRGELAGLQFQDLSCIERSGKIIWFLRIERSVSQNKFTAGEKYVLPPKSNKPRAVTIKADLAMEFQRYFKWQKETRGASSTSFVWPGKRGRAGRIENEVPASLHSFGNIIERLCGRSGLVDEHGKPLTTLHGLRATGASLAAERGVEPFVIQQQLGHAELRTTQESYLDLTAPEFLAGFTKAFDEPDDLSDDER